MAVVLWQLNNPAQVIGADLERMPTPFGGSMPIGSAPPPGGWRGPQKVF
jgi:hypothetical protein